MMQTLNFPCNPPTPTPTPSNHRFRCRAAVQSISPPMRKSGSFYEVLRVNRHASALEIKAAYRNLAKLYHPDSSSKSDGGDFIQIHNAYETLSDPAARALYDLSFGLGSFI
uniref:J domain-containing protein n=1 Tax=Chenopodium quinoa TaxID=63459 RepID=A0A803LQD8_CHEQI